MYRHVVYKNGTFTATDEFGRLITLEESVSFIYRVYVKGSHVTYTPLTYTNLIDLGMIHDYLVNGKVNEDLECIVIRYGWLDKRLNSLVFIPFLDLIKKFREGVHTPTDKRKLNAVLKQLTISSKHVSVI